MAATELSDQQEVIVTVTDDGLGIHPNVKDRMFDSFFTTKPIGPGLDLGLSTSYTIVTQQNQGRLECFSELGKGAQFVITLPLGTAV